MEPVRGRLCTQGANQGPRKQHIFQNVPGEKDSFPMSWKTENLSECSELQRLWKHVWEEKDFLSMFFQNVTHCYGSLGISENGLQGQKRAMGESMMVVTLRIPGVTPLHTRFSPWCPL